MKCHRQTISDKLSSTYFWFRSDFLLQDGCANDLWGQCSEPPEQVAMDEVSIDKLPKTSRHRHHHERTATSKPSQSNRVDVSSRYHVMFETCEQSEWLRESDPSRVTARERVEWPQESESSNRKSASRVTARERVNCFREDSSWSHDGYNKYGYASASPCCWVDTSTPRGERS